MDSRKIDLMVRPFAQAMALLLFFSWPLLANSEELRVSYEVAAPLKQQAPFLLSQKSRPLVVAYMPPATEFNFYLDLGQGIKEVAKAQGHETFLFAPQSDNPAEQMRMLEEVIRRRVDAIILSTHAPQSAAPLIKRAVKAGIVVVIINSDTPEFTAPVHAVVGYRQRKGSRKMGQYLVKKLGADTPLQVGIIEGAPGYHSSERVGGFQEAIADSKLKIVSSLNGKWNTQGGYASAMAMFKSHPDIQVVFAANDFEIIGVASALQTLGIEGVTLLGNDGDPAALERIADGKLTATVNTEPTSIGRVGMQVVIDSFEGRFKGGFVETPTVIVDQSNVLEFWQPPIALPNDDYQHLKVVSEQLPDLSSRYSYGLYIDILKTIFEPKGIKVEVVKAPYARGVDMVRRQQVDALLGASRGEVDRVIFPQWHYSAHIISIIFKKERLAQWLGQDSMLGKRVGWIRKYDYDRYLYVPVNRVEHTKRRSMLLMLALDRLDFVMDNEINLRYELNRESAYYESRNLFMEDYQIQEVMRLKLYLAFANTKKGASFARIFDESFAQLLASGQLKRLYDKWHVKPFPFK